MAEEIYKLIYLIEKDKSEIRILGEIFYQRNKLNGYYIYNNQRYPLKEKIETKKLKLNKENEFRILMIFKKQIFDKSLMFKDCILLLSFFQITHNISKEFNIMEFNIKSNISEEDNLIESSIYNFENRNSNNLIGDEIYNNMYNDFLKYYTESSIQSKKKSNHLTLVSIYTNLKNIKGNTNVLKGMFYNCSSLKYISDLTEWKTDNVFELSDLFYGCSSLESLPDISKWNTENMVSMNGLFANCSNLKSLPDISKWNISKINEIGRAHV